MLSKHSNIMHECPSIDTAGICTQYVAKVSNHYSSVLISSMTSSFFPFCYPLCACRCVHNSNYFNSNDIFYCKSASRMLNAFGEEVKRRKRRSKLSLFWMVWFWDVFLETYDYFLQTWIAFWSWARVRTKIPPWLHPGNSCIVRILGILFLNFFVIFDIWDCITNCLPPATTWIYSKYSVNGELKYLKFIKFVNSVPIIQFHGSAWL